MKFFALITIGLTVAALGCGDSEENPVGNRDIVVIVPDDGMVNNGVDMGMDAEDMPEEDMGTETGAYDIVTVESDPDAPIQVIEGTSLFVTFPNTAGQVSIWNAETAEREQVETSAPGPGLLWANPETGDYVVGAALGNKLVLNAWTAESEEFVTFAGQLTNIWLPAKGGHIGYASRPDGSLAMLDFVARTALIIDSSFGEDGEVIDIEEGESGRVLYRTMADPLQPVLFTPELREKTPAPSAEFARFIDDGKTLFISDESEGTRFYNPADDALVQVAIQKSTSFESFGRFAVIHFEERNDVLYDLEAEKAILVTPTITFPENAFSPDGKFAVFTGRGPTLLDVEAGSTRTIISTGVTEQVIYSSDSAKLSLTYSGFRPRMVVYDIVNLQVIYTDEILRLNADETDPSVPAILTPITMDASGRWIGYFDTQGATNAIAAYDSVDQLVWTLTSSAHSTACGLDIADDGSTMMFPYEDENGAVFLGQWIPGNESGATIASDITILEDCAAPKASANHDRIIYVQDTASAQRVAMFTPAGVRTVADGFNVKQLTTSNDLKTIDLRYDTQTGTRSTTAMGRYDADMGEYRVIENSAVRNQEVLQNEFGMAYRFVPDNCGETCVLGVRAYLWTDDEPTTVSEIGGRVRALVGPHVLFQGGRYDEDGEIISELQLARRLEQ